MRSRTQVVTCLTTSFFQRYADFQPTHCDLQELGLPLLPDAQGNDACVQPGFQLPNSSKNLAGQILLELGGKAAESRSSNRSPNRWFAMHRFLSQALHFGRLLALQFSTTVWTNTDQAKAQAKQ